MDLLINLVYFVVKVFTQLLDHIDCVTWLNSEALFLMVEGALRPSLFITKSLSQRSVNRLVE
jgi:hypothetical protein